MPGHMNKYPPEFLHIYTYHTHNSNVYKIKKPPLVLKPYVHTYRLDDLVFRNQCIIYFVLLHSNISADGFFELSDKKS